MNKDWTVLLIGGSSATGKSSLARQLAERYKTTISEVDDIRIALQVVLTSKSNPGLFTFLTNPDYAEIFTPEVFVQKIIDVGQEVWKPLSTLIDKHIACNEPIIFEGDSIIPQHVAQRDQSKIKTIFLYDDKESLEARELKRNRGGNSEILADKLAILSFEVSQEFKTQAERYGFKTIKASPIDTLLERVIKEIE